MRLFKVVNLPRSLGQGRLFETLSDQELARICGAVNKFNEWKNWADTPTGDRYMRDAVADVQSIISKVPKGIQPAAIQDIKNNCDNADDLIGFLKLNLPGTYPMTTPGQAPVATGDTSRDPGPIPPNTNPPVATGQPGPNRGAFDTRPLVQSGLPGPGYRPYQEPITPTGSEPPFQEPPSPPPPVPAMQRPPVATPSAGCWYTAGKGYSYGAYPGSGAELVPLSASDCQSLVQRDREVRGLPVETPGQVQQAQYQQPAQQTSFMGPGAFNQTSRPPDVASQDCGPGRFWDGVKCRGSVDQSASGLINAAASMGPSGGMTAPAGGINAGGYNGFNGTGNYGFTMGLKKRFPIRNI